MSAAHCAGAAVCRACAAAILGVSVDTFDRHARRRLPRISSAIVGADPRWPRRSVEALIEDHKEAPPCLRFAKDLGAIESVPEIRAPTRDQVLAEQADRRPMTDAERDLFLVDLLEHDELDALTTYCFMFYAGFRKSTVERMTSRWLNLELRTVTVPARSAKGGREYTIWLHDKALVALLVQMEKRGKLAPGESIFGEVDYEDLFWATVARCGIDEEGLTAHHVARHTAAQGAADKGASPLELKSAFGWATLQQTDRYTKTNAALAKRAMERLG